ncbi:hypothetical protein BJ992_001602 [Sphaerisporangium rubeum]|uniref:Uncharacterized protein n=1 Tax=Sphaerisporangium rubeum TaxID=321317 RepID=A0A7X0IBM1_9ACTN|nr:hypothetical protein [Sphaerisporangium rubeum]
MSSFMSLGAERTAEEEAVIGFREDTDRLVI